MRVLVCGSRNANDAASIQKVLDQLDPRPSFVITGCARGVDWMARIWAKMNGIPTLDYPADWKTHGRRAGPLRNQRMIDEGRPDLVIAFPGGIGTADMVARAKRARIRLLEVTQ